MPLRFNPKVGLIVIPCRITGPLGASLFRVAVDTGATRSLIAKDLLVSIGCDPTTAPAHVRASTASTVESLPLLTVTRVDALGHCEKNFKVLAHTLPSSLKIDGLLGLDFLRNRRLTLDFRQGLLRLS